MGPADAFAAAMLPDRWRVFGRTLQPLCAGHVLLMQRAGILAEDRASTVSDHLLVAWICSRPFDPDRPWRAMKLGLRGRAWAMLMQVVFRVRPLLFLVRAKLLESYITDGLAAPESWESAEGDRPIGAPWIAHYVIGLIATGIPLRDALMMPIVCGNWLLSTRSEQMGRLQLVSEHERAVMEALG